MSLGHTQLIFFSLVVDIACYIVKPCTRTALGVGRMVFNSAESRIITQVSLNYNNEMDRGGHSEMMRRVSENQLSKHTGQW